MNISNSSAWKKEKMKAVEALINGKGKIKIGGMATTMNVSHNKKVHMGVVIFPVEYMEDEE